MEEVIFINEKKRQRLLVVNEDGGVSIWVAFNDYNYFDLTTDQVRQLHTFLTEQLKKIDDEK